MASPTDNDLDGLLAALGDDDELSFDADATPEVYVDRAKRAQALYLGYMSRLTKYTADAPETRKLRAAMAEDLEFNDLAEEILKIAGSEHLWYKAAIRVEAKHAIKRCEARAEIESRKIQPLWGAF